MKTRKRKSASSTPADKPPTEETPTAAEEFYNVGISDVDVATGFIVNTHVELRLPLAEKDNFARMAFLLVKSGRSPFVKKPNDALNENLVRLRDEVLANGKHRTFKEVRTELQNIDPAWTFKGKTAALRDDAARRRYDRLKELRRR